MLPYLDLFTAKLEEPFAVLVQVLLAHQPADYNVTLILVKPALLWRQDAAVQRVAKARAWKPEAKEKRSLVNGSPSRIRFPTYLSERVWAVEQDQPWGHPEGAP